MKYAIHYIVTSQLPENTPSVEKLYKYKLSNIETWKISDYDTRNMQYIVASQLPENTPTVGGETIQIQIAKQNMKGK